MTFFARAKIGRKNEFNMIESEKMVTRISSFKPIGN